MDVVRLQEVVAKATEATTAEGVAQILVDEGAAVLGAALGGLWRLEGDQLVLVHLVGGAMRARFQRIPLAADAPLATCVREQRPIWLADAAEYERRFPSSLSRVNARLGCACLPLLVGGRPIGGAVFAFEGTRVFDEQEQASLMLIARQCAGVLERLRLAAAAQQLAGRMTALQAIAGRLAAARGLDEIVRIVIEEGLGPIGASTAAVWKLEGNEGVMVAQVGSPRSVVEAASRMRIDDHGALSAALRTRTSQFIGSREVAEARQQYNATRWEVVHAVAFVPLLVGTRLLGAIGLGFAEPRAFDTSEREQLELFAGHAAQAIARERDDAAQHLLAELSADLASSLDASTVLRRVGTLAVETLADWCFVDLVHGPSALERVVVAHADPANAALAEQLRGQPTPATTVVASVVESQQPLLVTRLTGEVIAATSVDPHRRAQAEALGARSVLCVPMSVGGRAIGTITWITCGRELDGRDLLVAAQIARAAAAALENARLYEAEAAAARRLGKLYDLSVALSSARTPEDVASATARLGTEATGALSCMIWILDDDGVLRARGSSAPPDWTAEWMELPKDPALPAYRVVATGEPVWVESPREYAHEAAVVFERVQRAGRLRPFAALPLVVGGVRAGVIAWGWNAERRFEPDERTFLHAIARSCEQAIERAQLYATEAGARASAESASHAKDEFLAMLGHELRNPLAPIVTALDLLRMRNIAEGTRERAVIERQVAHLTRLVDDLLDISRITRGKIELRHTTDELIHAVEPAIDAVGPLLVQHRHQLSVDVPATGLRVVGDPARLSQVVRNLLANAAKFTPPGGALAISARAVDGMVELTVRDNGRGITADLLPRVFEPFVQGSQGTERAAGGLGLGLAIVKNLVEMHGGRVTIHSDGPNRGTTVVVRLPRAGTAAIAEDRTTIAQSVRSLRVLVVDDNVDAATLLGDLLRLLGHEPVIAHDGAAALEIVAHANEQPQLAILDIGLPGMDGYELARRLREQPGLADVPVVALTGYGQASDRERTREAGFVEHLVKPIDLARLTDIVGRFTLD